MQREACRLADIVGQAANAQSHNFLGIHSDKIHMPGENACFRRCLK